MENNLNNNLSIRYNEETDIVEIYYNGEWVEWRNAGLTIFYIFKSGAGMQNDIIATVGDNSTVNISSSSIILTNTSGGEWRTLTFDCDCSQFLGLGKKLYVDLLIAGDVTAQERIVSSNSPTSWSPGTQQSLIGLAANTRSVFAIDIDSLFDITYKYISMTYYTKNATIYNMYIK